MRSNYRSFVGRLLGARGGAVEEAELLEALDAHAGLMIRAGAEVLGSASEAEDVSQDVIERLLRRRPAEVRSWPALLKTMVVNAAIDRVRRRCLEEQPGLEPAQPDEPDAAAEMQQRAAALRIALTRLSDRDARLFALKCHAGLDHAAIGEALGMTSNAVAVALHRLRERLTQELAQEVAHEMAQKPRFRQPGDRP